MNSEVKTADYVSNWRIESGVQIADGPSALEILACDNEPLPTLLQRPGDIHPAPRLIPFDRYIENRYVDLEVQHIWRKYWQVACRVEDIPAVGDFMSYDIIDDSYLIVRSGENKFNAYYNVCRHRGRKLCSGKGHGDKLRCAYHGWTYDFDGKLSWIPYQQDFPHLDPAYQGLVPI
jgi:phenylpropionate dioxygenase-like ring-hydroxylating dioxygenase large terminal subunit